MSDKAGANQPGVRLDKLLCYLRFSKSRNLARSWVEDGHFRRNGERVTQADLCVHAGDVLTLPLRSGVKVVEITALPDRRGSPSQAREHYRMLDPARRIGIAGARDRPAGGWQQEGPAAP